MTNTDNDDLEQWLPPHPCLRRLVEYIKTQIPVSDLHGEILAEQIVVILPKLFAENPEIFSTVLSMTGRSKDAVLPLKPECDRAD